MKMLKEELEEILKKHKKWLNAEEGGERADLRYANLSSSNLRSADLSSADLRYANLSYANLSYANLSSANLRSADLRYADLFSSNLRSADLSSADLSSANLRSADLSSADLSEDIMKSLTCITPEGSLIGWKKCIKGVIVKLRIPEDAKRSNATGRKCRAEYAEVLEIIGADEAQSSRHSDFVYRKGEIVRPDKWDDNRWEECSSGIHFFITRYEAEQYEL